MSHPQESSSSPSLKRKCEVSVSDSASIAKTLPDAERTLYNVIHSKKDMGIWTGDMKRETNLPDNIMKKSLKLLHDKKLIKEVVHYKKKNKKHFMASVFEPSSEITGGNWYNEGKIDSELINQMKEIFLTYIRREKVVTHNGVLDFFKGTFEVTIQQEEEILRMLVLDDEIVEVKSTGYGDFACVPAGTVCYMHKITDMGNGRDKVGAMASIPCGVCPRINSCIPNGVISPTTCVHYQDWIQF